MSLTIRPATPSELDDCAKQWVSSFEPGGQCSIGSTARTLAPKLWRRMHRALADALCAECTVVVLVLADVPHEPLAWACCDGETLHYVYTVAKARRRGLASKLLRHLGCSKHSHMTAGGEALLAALGKAVAA